MLPNHRHDPLLFPRCKQRVVQNNPCHGLGFHHPRIWRRSIVRETLMDGAELLVAPPLSEFCMNPKREAAIAAKWLTKAERRAIEWLPYGGQSRDLHAPGRPKPRRDTLNSLRELHACEAIDGSGGSAWRLTPLGQQIRTLLTGSLDLDEMLKLAENAEARTDMEKARQPSDDDEVPEPGSQGPLSEEYGN
ncbi:hypothetical protein [Roseomonas populi]|uniref:Restriction system protein Mrr-like N-terminal domain-containing protein n=1 Tax=Roseomonas populi TaxID=3121582 RepID=A0ABT1X3N8_9PROT|nr:hypothetical protein [Roseomonas pecuniae]MCR0982708.1 hypothetical protein [Roseomonas pecuniae]